MRTSRLTLAGAALVLVLAACSEAAETEPTALEPTAAETTETASATPDDDAATDEAAPPSDEATEDAEPDDDVVAGAGDAACLQGTWIFTADEVERTFEEMMTNVPGSPIDSVSVEGDSRMTFDGDTMRQEYDPPQVLTLDAGSSGIDMSMEFTWSGHTVGDYVVEGDRIRITSVTTSDFNVATRALVDGKEMEGLGDLGLGDLIGETGNALPEGQVEFACSGDTLRLTAIAPEDDSFRFDYDLVRE